MTMLAIQKHATHWSLTLNRPDKLNALSFELVEHLLCAFDDAASAAVPVLTLQGQGRCFSAGFDLSDVDSQSDGDLLLRFVRIEMLLNRIATSPCLTVAFAHGKNFGAGVDLIAACNMRIAAPGSTFRMPGLQFGLVLGIGRLARIVGSPEAQRILETSATFDIDRATQNGFIERVASLEQRAEVTAEAITRGTALSAQSRALLHQALDQERADADLAALVRSAATPGIKHRIDAYCKAVTASANL